MYYFIQHLRSAPLLLPHTKIESVSFAVVRSGYSMQAHFSFCVIVLVCIWNNVYFICTLCVCFWWAECVCFFLYGEVGTRGVMIYVCVFVCISILCIHKLCTMYMYILAWLYFVCNFASLFDLCT